MVRKKILKKTFQLSFIFIFVLSLLASSYAVLLPEKVSAGSPKLQAILDNINSNCKNMLKNGDTWKECEEMQAELVKSTLWSVDGGEYGCTNLFGEKANGRWTITAAKNKSCQRVINNGAGIARSAQLHLDYIKENCNGVDGGDWDDCEGMQNNLLPIGCSSNMFEKADDTKPFEGDNWYFIPEKVKECQQIINQMRTSGPTRPGGGGDDGGGGAGGAASDDASVNDIDCSGGGALGWIICPVFELGANMTQDVFDNIIRPMMEQVPVDTKGPFYTAWNNFRFLGNIVLIGAMLALVYAQARGGGR